MGHNEPAMAIPSDAELVERARGGDQSAFGALYDTWFDRVYDLAFRVVRDANAAADVAQDTFLSAWRELDALSDPAAFGGWVRRIARNTALNRRKKDHRAQPVDTKAMAVIESAGPSAAGAPAGFRVEDRLSAADDPARAAEDAELADLVWESADALGERDASVLDLQLRHGLTPAEIAEVVEVNRNHANQLVHRVRNRLGDAVRARVLWRGGEPVCSDLRTALSDAGIMSFGADAVRVATAHAEQCEECSERRRLRLEPSAMFAATPFLVAPVALKGRIADALAAEGVPMDGSAYRGKPEGNGGPGRPRWRSPRALAAAAAAVAVVLIGAVITARALTDDDGASNKAAPASAAETTTTTGGPPPAPTETSAPVPNSPIQPGPTGGPVQGPGPATPPPPPPPQPPPPPPPVVSATVSVSPGSKQSPYPNDGSAPVVQWSTSGGASVTVSGPGFSSSAPSGASPRLCPTASGAAWSVCSAAGSYTYTLTVRDGSGAVVAQRSATLTVGP
jgi:RNA polymerase sigma factor (sigma-70 family)